MRHNEWRMEGLHFWRLEEEFEFSQGLLRCSYADVPAVDRREFHLLLW